MPLLFILRSSTQHAFKDSQLAPLKRLKKKGGSGINISHPNCNIETTLLWQGKVSPISERAGVLALLVSVQAQINLEVLIHETAVFKAILCPKYDMLIWDIKDNISMLSRRTELVFQ